MNYEIGVTVILPCLNEEKTIAACIKNSLAGLKKLSLPSEIIVIDNGSTDKSITIAENLGAKVITESNKGYGFALMRGISESRYEYILMADADDSYELENLEKFIFELENDNDVVMGNRFKGGIEKGAMPFLHRYLGNPFLSFVGKNLFKLGINDFHCGMRAFRKSKILELNLITGGMEFASEMIVKASLKQFSMSEIPTRLRKDGRGTKSHLRTWRDGFRHLFFLFILSPLHLFIYPGLFFIILSIVNLVLASRATTSDSNLLFAKIWELIALSGGTIIFAGLILVNARQSYTNSNKKQRLDSSQKIYKFYDLIVSIALLFVGFFVNIINFKNSSLNWNDISSFGDIAIFAGLLLILQRLVITSFYYFKHD